MEKSVVEIPGTDFPAEVPFESRPEFEETTPHPQTPNPQANVEAEQAQDAAEAFQAAPIGFQPMAEGAD